MTNNNAPPDAVIDKAAARSNVAKELGFGAVNKYVARNQAPTIKCQKSNAESPARIKKARQRARRASFTHRMEPSRGRKTAARANLFISP
jgi:hypothetical protein